MAPVGRSAIRTDHGGFCSSSLLSRRIDYHVEWISDFGFLVTLHHLVAVLNSAHPFFLLFSLVSLPPPTNISIWHFSSKLSLTGLRAFSSKKVNPFGIRWDCSSFGRNGTDVGRSSEFRKDNACKCDCGEFPSAASEQELILLLRTFFH